MKPVSSFAATDMLVSLIGEFLPDFSIDAAGDY